MNLRIFKVSRRYKSFYIGGTITLFFALCAIFAEYIAPFDPIAQDMGAVLMPPGLRHWFGTDYLGRDIFSRIVFGSRVSLTVGFFSMFFAMVSGVILGLVAGFYGSWIDNAIMRIMDTLLAFPRLILAITITAFLGQSLWTVILALSITGMPLFSRLIRGQTLSIMTRDYIRSAKAFSASNIRIMTMHVLPNVLNLVIVQASLSVAFAILTEASMSFLGLGVPPPYPSWGMMLQSGYSYLGTAPWLALVPGTAIFMAVLGFNFLGEWLEHYIAHMAR